jgi:hypothetical protein
MATNPQHLATICHKKSSHNFYCECCDYISYRSSDYDKHILTRKHKNQQKSTEKSLNVVKKSSQTYHCETCDYNTSRKIDYDKHVLTRKHKNRQLSSIVVEKSSFVVKKSSSTEENICDICNKSYVDRSGLWRHKQKCKSMCFELENIKNENNNIADKDVIMLLIKQNCELLEMVKNGNNNTITHNNNNTNCINNNNNNNNNKTFNLHFFLNETCKDAMNITDFVNSLQLQLSDLESFGKLGFVDGVSNIIIKKLKALDENKRPIHCTDKKRETFYIKNDDKWEKEDENKSHIRKAINYVANENTLLIPQWKAKYPDYNDSASIHSDQYNNMIIEVLGGDDSCIVNENKIIKNIAREVIITK